MIWVLDLAVKYNLNYLISLTRSTTDYAAVSYKFHVGACISCKWLDIIYSEKVMYMATARPIRLAM